MKIRFRIWQRGTMYYPKERGSDYELEDWYISLSGSLCLIGPDYDGCDIEHYEKHAAIYMLSTGVKDKNGKEIWEGDILEFDEEEWGGGPPELRRWVVQWDKNLACWDFGGGTVGDCDSFKAVIGNVHENSELMEE